MICFVVSGPVDLCVNAKVCRPKSFARGGAGGGKSVEWNSILWCESTQCPANLSLANRAVYGTVDQVTALPTAWRVIVSAGRHSRRDVFLPVQCSAKPVL